MRLCSVCLVAMALGCVGEGPGDIVVIETPFPCGPDATCGVDQYCSATVGGTPDAGTSHGCVPLPPECVEQATCDCVDCGGGDCVDDVGLTCTLYAP